MAERLIEVKDLKVQFATEDGTVKAVDGVSFELQRGQVLGIVGESGSGKSVTAMTLLGLTRDKNTRFEGEVLYKGRDVLKMNEGALQDVRGNEMSMIFQDPMTSLNPVYTIGAQICEAIQIHERADKNTARRRSIDLLRQVGIPNADSRVDNYPHEFSGGMRQRAMIAMALSCNPDVLIADEPTTALDVTIQAQIIELIDKLKDDFNSSVILITHDLGVVADVADEILVMYAGRVVECGAKRSLFYDPQHPYTWGLLGSIPRLDRAKGGRLASIKGAPPSLINLPQGCKFRPRCPHVFGKCIEEPELVNRVEEPRHLDRCWLDVDEKRSVRDETIKGYVAAACARAAALRWSRSRAS
jgi:peptide/nickel transport system ATP-binding protein